MRRIAACLLLLAAAANANFLAEPQVQWSFTLPLSDQGETRGLRKGNAVVASQDDTLLFITSEDGSLHILRTQDGLPAADVYEPYTAQNTITYCTSGVALAEDQSEVQYALYAVIDEPDPESDASSSSTAVQR